MARVNAASTEDPVATLAAAANGQVSWHEAVAVLRTSVEQSPALAGSWKEALDQARQQGAMPPGVFEEAQRAIEHASLTEDGNGSDPGLTKVRIERPDLEPADRKVEDEASFRSPARDDPEVINGRYALERRLGGGGMGEVFLARDLMAEKHRDSDPFLALKLLNRELRKDQLAIMALQREGARAQKLSHKNIVRMYVFDEDERDGTPFVIMEYLRGRSLDQLIRDNPDGLSWSEADGLIRQLLDGLSYAHSEGLVHSDIKPNNIFITESNVVKVLDFGIASRVARPGAGADDPTRQRLDGSETVFDARRDLKALAPPYSSLEMWQGLRANPADDVYSVACVIYELLAGVHPFARLDAPSARQQARQVKPIARLTTSQNAALQNALAFEHAARTASVEELRRQLEGPPATPARARGDARPWSIAGLVVVLGLAVGYLLLPARTPPPGPANQAAETPEPSKAIDRATVNTAPAPRVVNLAAKEASLPNIAPSVDSGGRSTPVGELSSTSSPCPSLAGIDSIDQLIDRGIDLQTAYALGGATVDAELRDVVVCLETLESTGAATTQSRRLATELRTALGR